MPPPEDPNAPPPPGAWWVYVLWSEALARTYVGTTTDIARRLRQHNGELVGGARATRAGRPWQLAASYGPYPDRGTATRAELALKRRPGVRRFTWDGVVPASKGRTAPPQGSDP